MIQLYEERSNELLALFSLADPSRKAIKEALENGKVFCYVEKQTLLGALLFIRQQETIEITHLAVLERAENRHIATRLLAHMIEYAKKQKVTVLVIKTGSTSLKQLYLYQKMGFRMDAIVSDYFITHYDAPIFENGLRLYDQVVLKLEI